MGIEIEAYALRWNPTSGSAYCIKAKGGGWSDWRNIPSSDLAAVAAILRESPVYVGQDGALFTNAEAIGQ